MLRPAPGRKRIHRQAADQIGGSIGKTLGNVAQCEVRLVARDVDEILRHVQLQVDGWKPSAKILEARVSHLIAKLDSLFTTNVPSGRSASASVASAI